MQLKSRPTGALCHLSLSVWFCWHRSRADHKGGGSARGAAAILSLCEIYDDQAFQCGFLLADCLRAACRSAWTVDSVSRHSASGRNAKPATPSRRPYLHSLTEV
ncbi:unnamed protein product [Boreogadus saida]